MSGAGGRAQRPAVDPVFEGAVERREVRRADGLGRSFPAGREVRAAWGVLRWGWGAGALPHSPAGNTGCEKGVRCSRMAVGTWA